MPKKKRSTGSELNKKSKKAPAISKTIQQEVSNEPNKVSPVTVIMVYALCLFALGLAAAAAFAVYGLGMVLTNTLMLMLAGATAGVLAIGAVIGLGIYAYLGYRARSQFPAYFKVTPKFLAKLAGESADSEVRREMTSKLAQALIVQWDSNPSLFEANFKILEKSYDYPSKEKFYYSRGNTQPYNASSNVLHQFEVDGTNLRTLIIQSNDTQRAIQYIGRLIEIDFRISGEEKTALGEVYIITPYVIAALQNNKYAVVRAIISMCENKNHDQFLEALPGWTTTQLERGHPEILESQRAELVHMLGIIIEELNLSQSTPPSVQTEDADSAAPSPVSSPAPSPRASKQEQGASSAVKKKKA